jgi:hypothetical protein
MPHAIFSVHTLEPHMMSMGTMQDSLHQAAKSTTVTLQSLAK